MLEGVYVVWVDQVSDLMWGRSIVVGGAMIEVGRARCYDISGFSSIRYWLEGVC